VYFEKIFLKIQPNIFFRYFLFSMKMKAENEQNRYYIIMII